MIEHQRPSDANMGADRENSHRKTETRACCLCIFLGHWVHADRLDDKVAALPAVARRYHILKRRIYVNLDVDVTIFFAPQEHNGSSCTDAGTPNQQSLRIVHMRPEKLEGTAVAD